MENESLVSKLATTLVGVTFGILESTSIALAAGYQHARSPYNPTPDFIDIPMTIDMFKDYGLLVIIAGVTTGLIIDGALALYDRHKNTDLGSTLEQSRISQ